MPTESAYRSVIRAFQDQIHAVDSWSIRVVQETTEHLEVREGVLEPPRMDSTQGAMITVIQGRGIGYAATHQLSLEGLRAALDRARYWAELHARSGLFDASTLPRSSARAEYRTPSRHPWEAMPLTDRITLLQDADRALDWNERIVDRAAWLSFRRVQQWQINSDGAEIHSQQDFVLPGLFAVAHADGITQSRQGGGADWPQQGDLDPMRLRALAEDAPRVAEEAILLLEAPECPEDQRDLLLMPSQMALQIHESIGHPLELDRILGDERNYAGTSFIRPEMFGSYRYGSELLNVTFDPTVAQELCSVPCDDEGFPTRREYLIRKGILERPLGGALSQQRANLPGTSCQRASSWDRPAIDRMGNINLEPGRDRLEEMIRRTEKGILMDTNRSWSIDDSRNKFQFSCEWGQLIIDGSLGPVVRNPGYRGVSSAFWRRLAGVGSAEEREVRGVLNCGKGEPNQSVYVGHASPPCLFRDISIFGGGL